MHETKEDTQPAPLGALPSATPWRRLMAITYESIILFGVLWFADYAFSALTQFRGETGPLRTAFQIFTGILMMKKHYTIASLLLPTGECWINKFKITSGSLNKCPEQ